MTEISRWNERRPPKEGRALRDSDQEWGGSASRAAKVAIDDDLLSGGDDRSGLATLSDRGGHGGAGLCADVMRIGGTGFGECLSEGDAEQSGGDENELGFHRGSSISEFVHSEYFQRRSDCHLVSDAIQYNK